jgi:hypothetical protein
MHRTLINRQNISFLVLNTNFLRSYQFSHLLAEKGHDYTTKFNIQRRLLI